MKQSSGSKAHSTSTPPPEPNALINTPQEPNPRTDSRSGSESSLPQSKTESEMRYNSTCGNPSEYAKAPNPSKSPPAATLPC